MSNSALSSAKRRRANQAINNPTGPPGESVSTEQVPSQVNNNRPISLQQAIQLLNNRILQLEKKVRESKDATDENRELSNSVMPDALNMEMIIEKVTQSQIFEEFNHRYEVLATEILNLKHIVMKLQSYTLDINKTLVEERIQILSEMPEKQGISILEVRDDLNLRSDIEKMIENTDLEGVLEDDNTLGEFPQNTESVVSSENISFVLENNETEVIEQVEEDNVTQGLEEVEEKQKVEVSKKESKKESKKSMQLDV